MTMPDERANAINNTYDFLLALMSKEQTPRVPMKVRLRARSLLKHYPSRHYILLAQEKAPEVFGEKKK